MTQAQEFGRYLKTAREGKRLTLRAVESKTEISNAYLSQLEGGKIKNPSPNVLHKLSELYELPYNVMMKMAGYPMPDLGDSQDSSKLSFAARIGPTTEDEEEELLEYLQFLRAKRRRGKE